MAGKITWDQIGEKTIENGVDRGVLWVPTITDGKPVYTSSKSIPWSGLTAVNEAPTGGEPQDMWADNIKYMSLMSQEQYVFTIESYMFPEEFYACDGGIITNGVIVTQQARSPFCFSWRTKIANDVTGFDYGYKLHFAWGCLAKPASKDMATLNDTPEGATFSFEVNTTPILTKVGTKEIPISHVCIDTTKLSAAQKTKLEALEKTIYGVDADTENNVTAADGIYVTPTAVIAAMGTTTGEG